MNNYVSRAQTIIQQIERLGEISDEGRILTRLFGSEAHFQANQRVMHWMNEIGLETWVDNIGNVRGRLRGGEKAKKVFVMGSHLDTVRNAGKFDGVLGVLMALDAARNLMDKQEELPFHLEIVGFSDEEGVRFNLAYMGSSVLSGQFNDAWLDKTGIYGKTLASVIREMGKEVGQIPKDKIPQEDWLGYLEVHVEQGPVLFQKKIPVGVVGSITGQTRVNVFINGKPGHAGTTPMHMRKDALAAAAEFIHEVENYAMAKKDSLVATVGAIHSYPNIANVISSKARCSVDIRSANDEVMDSAAAHFEQTFHSIIQKRGMQGQWEILQRNPKVACDEGLRKLLVKAIQDAGVAGIEEIHSGAGHDAVAISPVAPVSMLFVQCKNGISHHPEEYVTSDNIEASIRVLDKFMEGLIEVSGERREG